LPCRPNRGEGPSSRMELGGFAVGPEVLGPDDRPRVAFEGAAVAVDPDLGEVTEDVGPVLGGAHPGAEDRAHRAVGAGAPGEVLAGAPALGGEIAAGADPVGEFATAGVVAEAVAAEDVFGLVGRRFLQLRG